MNEQFFCIPQNLFQDENVNDTILATYCAILYLRYSPHKHVFFNSDYMMYSIFETFEGNERFRRNIESSLMVLQELGYISFERLHKDNYIVDRSGLTTNGQKFIKIFASDFLTIMRCDKKSKLSMFRYFVQLVRSFDYRIEVNGKRGVVGNMSTQYNAEQAKISLKTAMSYNYDLRTLGVIYVVRPIHEAGINSFYGRMADKEEIDKYAYENCNPVTGINEQNCKRSLMQKYNWLMKGKEYPPAEVEKIRSYIIQYNNKQMELAEKFGFEPNIKPLPNLQ